MTTILTTRFTDALVFAAQLHARQKRKASDVPYIAHLLSVCALVLEHGGDEDEAIAALLHDAVEDQGGEPTLREIRDRFGPRVADIVSGCTDADVAPKPPWRARKEAHLQHLQTASPSVLLVVAADKLHNVRSVLADYRRLGDELWSRFNGGQTGTLWYYTAMSELLSQADLPPATRDLCQELDRSVRCLREMAGN